jgi:hypothetical protein
MIPTLNSWRLNNDENESLKRKKKLFFGQKKTPKTNLCAKGLFYFYCDSKEIENKVFLSNPPKTFLIKLFTNKGQFNLCVKIPLKVVNMILEHWKLLNVITGNVINRFILSVWQLVK